ncbi:MAG: hypothetical protein H7A40_06890 [Chlamydiales bacterium]|nr:hypothetical protein [Chlamydiales bacterium]
MSPNRPLKDCIIYEMHVRGFTQHPSSHVKYPGTYLGAIEKIPHLLDLGINCVELMPIFQFDASRNYWGYDTTDFFAPMNRYGVNDPAAELKLLIKSFHEAGIEVILDVVYNHSPNLPAEYYIMSNNKHTNYSGCGNTLSANTSPTREMIIQSLSYWVNEYAIDGFRFDLAAALTRGPDGNRLEPSPIIEEITACFKGKKLIAEPWDAAGLYLLGQFPSGWGEWNDQYRDGVRKLVNFNEPFKEHWDARSLPINYITSHDGFTLYDLVTYPEKHNAANGEGNQDGSDQNFSVAATDKLANMKAFIEHLFSSKGTPMLLMGDEYGHTRKGNNNAWCQDNELNWFLWDQLDANLDWYNFVKDCIVKRKERLS